MGFARWWLDVSSLCSAIWWTVALPSRRRDLDGKTASATRRGGLISRSATALSRSLEAQHRTHLGTTTVLAPTHQTEASEEETTRTTTTWDLPREEEAT